MITQILEFNSYDINDDLVKNNIKIATDILNSGGLVAFPTETVYGLGCNSHNIDAVRKVYEVKGRPSDNPLILHVSNNNSVYDLIKNPPDILDNLLDTFFPGALTLILEKSDTISSEITAGRDTIAIRRPSHKLADLLISSFNKPISAPSANLSGTPSCTRFSHVFADLNGKVDAIIHDISANSEENLGIESTILDLSKYTTQNTTRILRPGSITSSELAPYLNNTLLQTVEQTEISNDTEIEAIAPGMKYKHYAPTAKLRLFKGDINNVVNTINSLINENIANNPKISIGVLCTTETYNCYNLNICKPISCGTRSTPSTIASNLFATLRQFDEYGVDLILSESFEGDGIEFSIMNRLNKASSYDIIVV